MKYFFLILSSFFVIEDVARDATDNKQSLSGAYKDYDDMYNGGYLSEEEKKVIGVEEDTKHSLNNVFITSFKDIQNSITPQWHSFTKGKDIYNISKLDMSSYRQKHFYKLQDLGTYGSPTKPFQHVITYKITQTDGYGAFKLYKMEDIIYDTRTPLLGFRTIYNKYSNSFDINLFFATSISKNIHFGITGRPIFQERLFGLIEKEHKIYQNKSADMNVMQIPLTGYLFLRSDDNKHLLFLRMSMSHIKISERGGIRKCFNCYHSMFTAQNNIDDEDILQTTDVVYKGLIYYQYQIQDYYAYIKNTIKLKYCSFDFNIEPELEHQTDNTKRIIIKDKKAHKRTIQYLFTNSAELMYDDKDSCQAYTPFNTTDRFITDCLEVGIKKVLKKHLTIRHFIQFNILKRNLQNNVYDNNTKQLIFNQNESKDFDLITEPLLVGCVANVYDIKIQGKILFFKMINCQIKPCLYFHFSAKYEKSFLHIHLDIIRQQVQEIFKYYSSYNVNVRNYDHTAQNPFKDPFKIRLKHTAIFRIFSNRVMIRKYGNWILHTNHLFFVQTNGTQTISCEPKQNTKWLLDICKGFFVKINISGPLFFEIDVNFNKKCEIKKSNPLNWFKSNNEILNNVPAINIYSRFYFCKDFANGSANLTTGIDMLYATGHIGDKYDPITQQFFQQSVNQQYTYKYPIVNAFLNFRFGEFVFSAKINNLLQLLGIVYSNYCNTPFYPTWPAGYMLTIQYIFVD